MSKRTSAKVKLPMKESSKKPASTTSEGNDWILDEAETFVDADFHDCRVINDICRVLAKRITASKRIGRIDWERPMVADDSPTELDARDILLGGMKLGPLETAEASNAFIWPLTLVSDMPEAQSVRLTLTFLSDLTGAMALRDNDDTLSRECVFRVFIDGHLFRFGRHPNDDMPCGLLSPQRTGNESDEPE